MFRAIRGRAETHFRGQKMKVRYASNGGPVGDGVRITRVWTDQRGFQRMAVMVDEKTERYSEIEVVADDISAPDETPEPEPTNTAPIARDATVNIEVKV